jgi:hypothetical protein
MTPEPKLLEATEPELHFHYMRASYVGETRFWICVGCGHIEQH